LKTQKIGIRCVVVDPSYPYLLSINCGAQGSPTPCGFTIRLLAKRYFRRRVLQKVY